MKKIIVLLLAVVLSFSIFASCKKKGESLAVIVPESTSESASESQSQEPTVAEQLSDALASQFQSVASVKIATTRKSEDISEDHYSYWDEEAGEEVDEKETYGYAQEDVTTMYISFGEDGKVDAKIETEYMYNSLTSDYDYSYTSVAYVVDNVGYSYEEEIDMWVKNHEVTRGIEEVVSFINSVKEGELVSDEEIEALFAEIGEAISVSFNLVDKSVELSIDASQTIKDFLAIFEDVDTSTKTVTETLNDILNFVNEGLTIESILAKAEEVSALTVNQAIVEIDAWLTQNYQTTLQGIYSDLVAREELVDFIVDELPIGFESDEERDAFKTEILNFNLAEEIAQMQIGELTLFEVLSANVGFPEELTASDFFTETENMLSVAIDDYQGTPAIKYMILNFIEMSEEIQDVKVVAELGAKFADNFALSELSFGYVTEISSKTEPYEGEDSYCASELKTEFSLSVSEISTTPLSIALPEGEQAVDLYNAGNYYNGDDELFIENYGDGEVYLSLYKTHNTGVGIKLEAQLPNEALFSDTITIDKEDVVIYIGDEATEITLSENLVVKVNVETEKFEVLSNIDVSFAETVQMAFDSILAGESTYRLDEDLPFTLVRLVDASRSTYKIGLLADSPASAFTVICTTDYVTGTMTCKVEAIFVDIEKSGNLRNPNSGSGWYGATYEEEEILAYLGGDITFELELREDGTIVCSDFVEFDPQYVEES